MTSATDTASLPVQAGQAGLTDEQTARLLRWIFTPTIRERWYAFSRLYRALRRDDPAADGSIADAARISLRPLERGWYDVIRGQGVDRMTVPRFMRDIMYKKHRYIATAGRTIGTPDVDVSGKEST